MKLGIHAYAWCSEWNNKQLGLIDRAKSLGLDFIEIPLMVLERYDAGAVKRKLTEAGFEGVTSTVLLGDTDITSPEEAIRRKGVSYLKDCVKATAMSGMMNFSGVIYSQHIRQLDTKPSEREFQWSAEGLREVAEYAEDLGVVIGIEPVNRYETFLVNTCAQARMLLDMIGRKNVKIHLDTYHMNIEEKSFYEATLLAGSELMHVHLCENDRGIPGTGLVNWEDVFRALSEIGYKGHAALESFVDCTGNMNTWVWRQLAPSGDQLVRDGLAFIQGMMAKYGMRP
ncbi:MAG: sugar phosphate isomerase/epimerase family protein [Clostridia bacterium]